MGKIKKTETPARRRVNGGLAKVDATKSGMVRARIDPELKDRVETILSTLGLNASDDFSSAFSTLELSWKTVCRSR